MKIGAENKKQVRWMIALLAILLLVGIYNFVDFGTSSANSPAPAPAPATSTQTTTQTTKKSTSATQLPDSTLDPRLRLDILAASQNKKYEAGGRNIFRMEELKPDRKDHCGCQSSHMGLSRRPRRRQRRLHRRSRSSFTALPASPASRRGSFLLMKVKYSSPGKVTSWKENIRSSRSITPA